MRENNRAPEYCTNKKQYGDSLQCKICKETELYRICWDEEYEGRIYERNDDKIVVLSKGRGKDSLPEFAAMPGPIEDFLVQIAYLHPDEPNLKELYELVRELIRMIFQKTGGETEKTTRNGDIPFKGNYERVRMGLINHGIRLARSGMIDKINKTGNMKKLEKVDKTKMKDRDRNEAKIKELFYGEKIFETDLKLFVDELEKAQKENKPTEKIKMKIILETVVIVLSGRLGRVE